MIYEDDLVIKFKGVAISKLNARLVDRQKCHNNVKLIVNLHVKKMEIYEKIIHETQIDKLSDYAQELTELEFQLQELWNFNKDINFHKFWETPKCECPRFDNNDRYPYGNYIVNNECPLHGFNKKEK